MELEVLKRPILKPTLYIVMVQRNGRAKRDSLAPNVKGPSQSIAALIFFLSFFFPSNVYIVMRKEEGGKRSNMDIIPKTNRFRHILLKKSAHPILGAWSLLLVHVRFTPNILFRGPKA